MGRTIPSFRLACVAEELKWRTFRSKLRKDDRKTFDEMFSTSRLYNSACSNSAKPIVLECIIMAIMLHHFKQLRALLNNKRDYQSDKTTKK